MISNKDNGFTTQHLTVLIWIYYRHWNSSIWSPVSPQISISCSIYFEIHLVSQNYISENMFITEEFRYLQFIFLSIIMLYFKKRDSKITKKENILSIIITKTSTTVIIILICFRFVI